MLDCTNVEFHKSTRNFQSLCLSAIVTVDFRWDTISSNPSFNFPADLISQLVLQWAHFCKREPVFYDLNTVVPKPWLWNRPFHVSLNLYISFCCRWPGKDACHDDWVLEGFLVHILYLCLHIQIYHDSCLPTKNDLKFCCLFSIWTDDLL